jgi:hypothetical protein
MIWIGDFIRGSLSNSTTTRARVKISQVSITKLNIYNTWKLQLSIWKYWLIDFLGADLEMHIANQWLAIVNCRKVSPFVHLTYLTGRKHFLQHTVRRSWDIVCSLAQAKVIDRGLVKLAPPPTSSSFPVNK